MINTLLANPLIQKYFGCEGQSCVDKHYYYPCPYMCRRILQAMCEPIKPMEQALQYQGSSAGHWQILMTNGTGKTIEGWHPNDLRLPDAFQTKRLCYCGCGCNACCHPQVEKPDPVEEKILELAHAFHSWIARSGERDIRKELRDLVALAREVK